MAATIEHKHFALVPATLTRCPRKKCGGALWRTGDGADRLSEYLGRIVVRCSCCGDRLSLSVSRNKQT